MEHLVCSYCGYNCGLLGAYADSMVWYCSQI